MVGNVSPQPETSKPLARAAHLILWSVVVSPLPVAQLVSDGPGGVVHVAPGRYLDVGSNAISGTIPKELSSIKDLEYLDLSANKLTGNIPTQFTALAALTWFDVSDNTLSKAIPTTLGAWGKAVADAG